MKIAWTTTETREQAAKLATICVESKLTACVQISGPITSIYTWNGKIEEAIEYRLTFKFPSFKLQALRERVLRNHPYETPQWVAVDTTDVSEAYKTWAENQIS
jgi:periplasmic divalent cation tolerance protein